MKASVIVQNLKCNGCAKTIVSKLSELENITHVNVDKDTSTVSFTYQDVNEALLVKEHLKSLGYPSIDEENTILSKARSFVSCATGKMSDK